MKINKNKIENKLGEIDIFICTSGFEDRSTFLSEFLNKNKVHDAVLFHLKDNYVQAEKNAQVIKNNLPQTIIKEYPRNNIIETFDIFYNFLEEKVTKNKKRRVVVDITTFTKEVILVLIKALSLDCFKNNFEVLIVYNPSENYPNWLSKGIRNIRSVFGYSGVYLPSKKLILIVLNGFETERTMSIIDCFEPNKLVLGKPSKKDSINIDLNEKADLKFCNVRDKYSSIIEDTFEFSCKDIASTKSTIKKIVDKYQDEYNIIISPLNNKISTLSVALLGIENENIQICYASANQYNITSYSEKSDYFLVYNLNDLLEQP